MVRPIFVKAGSSSNVSKSVNEVDKIQCADTLAVPLITGSKEISKQYSRAGNSASTQAERNIIRIPDNDDDLRKSRNVTGNQLELVKSSADQDIRAVEGETVMTMASLRNQVTPQVRNKPKFALLPENPTFNRENIPLLKPDSSRVVRPFSHEDPVRSLSALRDLSAQYEVGPRVVSEPLLTNRDQSTIMSDLAFAQRIRNGFAPVEIVQSSRMNNLVSNMNDLGPPGLNPWGALDLNPLTLNAYMKSMQEQAFRRNQAILQRDRNMIFNQALSQQQALNHNIPGLTGGAAPGINLMEQRGVGQGFHGYPAPLTCKEDLNKNAVSALNYIAKMGKNKRGRPKRNPAEGWPKRPLSAYNIFFKECREKIVGEEEKKDTEEEKTEANNTALKPHSRRKRRKKHGKISFGGLAKSVGALWKELSADQMTYYERKAEASREAYRKEIKIFLEKRNKTFTEKKNSNDDENA